QAQTQLWFEQTQASRILQRGELPDWFHGFISRREAEQLLQEKPPGSFLVRFSESTVGFVLSYRGRDRCRHFILDQLADERYVILGEDSAHAELSGLLQHYALAPVTPYYEFLTEPCARVRGGGFASHSQSSQPAGPFLPPEDVSSSSSTVRRIYYEPDEPIPFYAMGRGALSTPASPENIYSEVKQEDSSFGRDSHCHPCLRTIWKSKRIPLCGRTTFPHCHDTPPFFSELALLSQRHHYALH
uniref:SH2 domain containing 2A n=1 Tax=Sphenodon punctatus TaxID=8508 RepID=A0A8D0G7S1_SPHPU